MSLDLNEKFVDRGPIPGKIIITLKAQADMDENTVVTFGTANKTCKKAGATDYLLGWTQGKALSGKIASIHLARPMWKGVVAAASADIQFGETLELAGAGELKAAVAGSGNTIAGKALEDATPTNGFVQFIPEVCCPTAATS